MVEQKEQFARIKKDTGRSARDEREVVLSRQLQNGARQQMEIAYAKSSHRNSGSLSDLRKQQQRPQGRVPDAAEGIDDFIA